LHFLLCISHVQLDAPVGFAPSHREKHEIQIVILSQEQEKHFHRIRFPLTGNNIHIVILLLCNLNISNRHLL
jgi:hypothetical protein